MIYEALQESYGQTREVTLEDVIRVGCGYRHYLHLSGAERKRPQKPSDILLRRYEDKVRLAVSAYFRGRYGDRYRPGSYQTHGRVLVRVDGWITPISTQESPGRVVDIQVVSSSDFSSARAPRYAIASAAYKAGKAGDGSALLVVVNRDNQEMAMWLIDKCPESLKRDIEHDVEYINRLVDNSAMPMGTASRTTCRVCPYKDPCGMPATEDPEPYDTSDIRVVPGLAYYKEVDAYLWGLNDVPSGRQTKVIHPSSFSISKCDRQIAYDLLGVDQHHKIGPRLRLIFDAGHAIHDVVQGALDLSSSDFEPEVLVVDEKLKIHGHCDGRLSPEVGIEIKSIGSKGFKSLQKAKPEHEAQATIYGAILGLQKIHYVYVNKETGDIAEFVVPVSRKLWHKQAARASNIHKTVEMGDMPPQIDKDYVCRNCAYAWTCKPEMGSTESEKQKRTFA